jgi:AcrR family transcriptional regulator
MAMRDSVSDSATADTEAGGSAERRSPETARRERTRRRILDVAFRLIGHERGRSVRIEQICAEAKISRGSFYNYFVGIEPLFEALADDLTHKFTLAVIAEMNRMPSAAEQADVAMRYYLGRARSDPAWGWAMVNIGATGPLFGAETSASALHTVAAGIAAGEFVLKDATVGRDLVLGTCQAALISHLRDGSAEDQPRLVSRSVLRGLGVPPDRIEAILLRDLPLLKG